MIRKARTLGSQIADLCKEQGITKAELADHFLGGVSPSNLSHMIRRSDRHFIEEIAYELGVPPEYFDDYVLLLVDGMVEMDSRLIAVLRGYMKAGAGEREKWFKSSEKVFQLSKDI